MKFYSDVIFPRILDLSMSSSLMSQYRQQLLSDVEGDVLEIGFGTGLNLPYYPKTVRKLTAVDPNPGMSDLAQKRLKETSLDVETCQLSGESLPMGDNTFDCVVSSWTLCSIPNVDQALREIHRVLKPEGRLFFVEHGLSSEPQVQAWQNRLTPIQKRIADGCHLNRNIQQLIEEANFRLSQLEEFYMEDTPKVFKVFGYLYRGVATKTLSQAQTIYS